MPPKTNTTFHWPRPQPGELVDASNDRMIAAIVPGRMVAGVHAPGYVKMDPTRTTYDWRKPAWSAENRAGIRALSEVGELRELLLCDHMEFSHILTYVIVHTASGAIEDSCFQTGSLWQPRVNKSSDAIGWLRSQGLDVWAVLICLDMDTPGHVPWTDELKAKALEIINKSVLLLTCCWYWTTAGLRAIQPIFHIPVDKLEPLLYEWLEALKAEGFTVDFSCVDWTRLMKMPKTLNSRTGERVDFPPQNLDGMKKIDLEALLDGIYGNPDPTDTRPRRERVKVVEPVPEPRKVKTPKVSKGEAKEPVNDPGHAPPTSAPTPAYAPTHDHDADKGDPKDLDANGFINFSDPVPTIWEYRAKAIGREIFEVTKAGKLGPKGEHLSHHHLYRAIAGYLRYCKKEQHGSDEDLDELKNEEIKARTVVRRRFVPGIVRLIIRYAQEPSHRVEDFVRSAKEIILHKQKGGLVPGVTHLRDFWPTVSAVLVQETIHPNESVCPGEDGKPVKILSTDEAYAELEKAFLAAPDGVLGIGACAGLGKTKLIREIGLKNMEDKPPNPKTGRAPRGGKSGATFDKHALAIQVRQDILDLKDKDGNNDKKDAKRLFGPASLKDANGKYVCIFADQAASIAEGGSSVFREFCQGGGTKETDRCPEWAKGCQARKGYVGPEKGQFILGPHAKKGDVAKQVGPYGRMSIDEPPPLLKSIAITVENIQDAMKDSEGFFHDRYRRTLAPLLFAFEVLIPTNSVFLTGDTTSFEDSVRKAVEAIQSVPELEDVAIKHLRLAELATKQMPPSTDLYEAIVFYAKMAISPKAKHKGPPYIKWKIPQLRDKSARSKTLAKKVGQAGRVFNTLREAICSPYNIVTRMDYNKIKDKRVFNVVMPDAEYIDVLRRTGPTILSDANLELHWDVLKAIVEPVKWGTDDEGKPIVVDNGQLLKYKLGDPLVVHAFDGAEIRRVMLCDSRAIKRHWFSYGKPVWEAGIIDALSACFKVAKEPIPGVTPAKRSLELCLITFKIVRLAIEYALGKPQSKSDVEWVEHLKWIQTEWLAMEARPTLDDLEDAKKKLTKVLTEWTSGEHPGTIIFGHYGGVRGLNSAKLVDSIVTLGDPWPNLGAIRTEATYLGVDVDRRSRRHIAAELYQAQERLRSCRRIESAIAIHYGNARPGGPMWAGKRVEEIYIRPVGHPNEKEEAATGEWLVDLMDTCNVSGKELADFLGLSQSTVSRMRSGEAVISEPDRIRIKESVLKIVDVRKKPQGGSVRDKIASISNQSLFPFGNA